jgi:hypothetical protein
MLEGGWAGWNWNQERGMVLALAVGLVRLSSSSSHDALVQRKRVWGGGGGGGRRGAESTVVIP